MPSSGSKSNRSTPFGPDWPLYVRLRRGLAQLHLSEHRLDGGPATHVYLYVEDVDSIILAGMDAEDCPWGMREARLTDPDGNEVRVGSPLRNRNQQTQPDSSKIAGSLAAINHSGSQITAVRLAEHYAWGRYHGPPGPPCGAHPLLITPASDGSASPRRSDRCDANARALSSERQ
jgi:hypothetical protein